jgi:hypothetical protein
MTHPFRILAGLVAASVLGIQAWAAEGTEPKPAAAPAATPSNTHPITQAAVKAGVLACAARVNQVANFLTANSQSGAFLFTPGAQPDQRLFSTSLEVSSPNTPPAYASASFAPNQANGCAALYETVSYWPSACDKVAAQQFAGLKDGGKLGTRTQLLVLGPSSRVFLMPAGTGCVSIKKEVIH